MVVHAFPSWTNLKEDNWSCGSHFGAMNWITLKHKKLYWVYMFFHACTIYSFWKLKKIIRLSNYCIELNHFEKSAMDGSNCLECCKINGVLYTMY